MGLVPVFDEILDAARVGAHWAWTRLYDEYSPLLFAYARSRGAPDAEDLVGEVFLQVVRDLGSFQGGESDFRRWIFTVTRNRMIDSLRHRRRRPFDATDPAELASHGPTGNAEDEALEGIVTEELQELLLSLTPDQREVLLLRVFGDLSIDQIAIVVGKRPGAVKALQHRALATLRKILQSGVTISDS
ncbi:MAG TPA: sigma-70 family RNA polymerase sigma factor [Acidimicrobiia bacterium]|nr:sigma-70 family RNA polymerase sigma factor [Acidimicrobiia bacterium]